MTHLPVAVVERAVDGRLHLGPFEGCEGEDGPTTDSGLVVAGGEDRWQPSRVADRTERRGRRLSHEWVAVLGGEGDQYCEAGVSYYAGDYMSSGAGMEFDEHLFGVHGFIAPQPFGLQFEFYDGETEGHDIDGWYAMPICRVSPEGTAFVRFDDMNGWRKGKNADHSRHRWALGYAHQVDSASRVTVEYDKEDLDTPGGGSSDEFGVQWMTGY